MSAPRLRLGAALARHTILLLALAATVLPLLWVATSSLKTDVAIFEAPFALPALTDLQWRNYERAWTDGGLARPMFDSVLLTTVAVIAILALGAPVAYACARFRFRGRDGLYVLLLAGLLLPLQLAVIPLFFQLRSWGLLQTRPGLLLVYVAQGLPFAVFVLAPFFRRLPATLHEAARLDGCSEWAAFHRVFLPLARPALVTVGLFQFIGLWKEFFLALVLLAGGGSDSIRTLPLALAHLAVSSQYRTDWGAGFAGLMLVILPLLIVHLFLQRHLVTGLAGGAVKG
jgi:ABC-type glycerol-3-phosphate transport system permease component